MTGTNELALLVSPGIQTSQMGADFVEGQYAIFRMGKPELPFGVIDRRGVNGWRVGRRTQGKHATELTLLEARHSKEKTDAAHVDQQNA
jgi:hypothetical protein